MDRFLGRSPLGNRGAWALIGIMAIVAVLGYQQYRWIVRVAAAEEKTNRENLEASLRQFTDDFDTEITRTYLTFQGLDGASTADVLQKATERLQEFRRLSKYPGLVAAINVAEGLPDPFTIHAGPPLAFVVPVAMLQARGKSVAGPYLATQPFAETASQLRVGTRVGMRFGGTVLRLQVALDQDYLAGVMLPKLLDRHLGLNSQDQYDLLVQSVQTGKILRQTGTSASQPWDESRPIFSIRPDCLSGQMDPGAVTASSRTTTTLTSLLQQPAVCRDVSGSPTGVWMLHIRARPSLAGAAALAKNQNVAISFAVLLVLAAAAAVLFVSAHRAGELAALHKQFAAGVSHELRTPLSIISSASENLADGVVESAEEVRRYGRMIHSHSEQLAAMIENALWFARKDPKGSLEKEELDVQDLVNTAATTCGRMLEEAGVRLERNIEPELPPIRGNRALLLAGLQNLLTNIALYARAGKWAQVRAVRQGNVVQFTIEDRGAGILPEETERVFQPFYRGKGAKQANVAGLGLGLALVRRIVEAHDGNIELRSQRGAGTAVAFSVPISGGESKPLMCDDPGSAVE
jgi:signal transduction histidine kinase